MSAQHRGADPDDVQILTGQWHVGRHFPGMFPAIESLCPCPKARCGLATPIATTHCEQHMGHHTIRQSHHENDCDEYMHDRRRRQRS